MLLYLYLIDNISIVSTFIKSCFLKKKCINCLLIKYSAEMCSHLSSVKLFSYKICQLAY